MRLLFTLFALSLTLFSCISVQEAANVVELAQAHTRIAVVPIDATVERKIWMTQDKYNELKAKKPSSAFTISCSFIPEMAASTPKS